ncbi:MAG: D-alanyl-D-alanine carboxypeptidase family protein [Clostridium sp.]
MNTLKKIIACAITLITLSSNLVFAAPPAPSASAEGVVVMNAATGEVLYGKNENVKYPPASPTKLMTALLTLENCDLDEKVTISELPPTIEGSKIYIDKDEVLTVRELLYSLIMVSANDCATALAEHIGGSVDNFAKMMNKRAKELGCKNTNFTNPHGLYEKNHRTTAYDLALMEKELLKNPTYLEISKTKNTFLEPTNKFKEKRPLWNDNRLVQPTSEYYYEPCLAAKTGFTDESLHSFVASARKGNETFIVSLLRDQNKTYFKDSRELFEWAFKNFQTVQLYEKNDSITEYKSKDGLSIPLLAGQNLYYTKDLTLKEEPKITYNIDNIKNSAILAGQKVGYIHLEYNGVEKDIPLLSEKDYLPIKNNSPYDYITNSTNDLNLILTGTITSTISILLFYIIRKLRRKKERKKLYFKQRKY